MSDTPPDPDEWADRIDVRDLLRDDLEDDDPDDDEYDDPGARHGV